MGSQGGNKRGNEPCLGFLRDWPDLSGGGGEGDNNSDAGVLGFL